MPPSTPAGGRWRNPYAPVHRRCACAASRRRGTFDATFLPMPAFRCHPPPCLSFAATTSKRTARNVASGPLLGRLLRQCHSLNTRFPASGSCVSSPPARSRSPASVCTACMHAHLRLPEIKPAGARAARHHLRHERKGHEGGWCGRAVGICNLDGHDAPRWPRWPRWPMPPPSRAKMSNQKRCLFEKSPAVCYKAPLRHSENTPPPNAKHQYFFRRQERNKKKH